MRRSVKRSRMLGSCRPSRLKPLFLALAAMPVFQFVDCFPNPLMALNFELQALFNTALANAANILIQNLLGF